MKKTPKEARAKLFEQSRPEIRPLVAINENGEMGHDMAVLWAAYRMGSFPVFGETDQNGFTQLMANYLSRYAFAWVVDDRNGKYPSGFGPIGLIVARYDGWGLEPHFNPFSWSTPRNRLRTVIAYLQMMRYEKSVGIVNVNSGDDHAAIFRKIAKTYGILYYIGKIPRGDHGMDRHIFYGRGGSYFKGRKAWAA